MIYNYIQTNTVTESIKEEEIISVVWNEYCNYKQLLDNCTDESVKPIIEAQVEVLYEVSIKDIIAKIKECINKAIEFIQKMVRYTLNKIRNASFDRLNDKIIKILKEFKPKESIISEAIIDGEELKVHKYIFKGLESTNLQLFEYLTSGIEGLPKDIINMKRVDRKYTNMILKREQNLDIVEIQNVYDNCKSAFEKYKDDISYTIKYFDENNKMLAIQHNVDNYVNELVNTRSELRMYDKCIKPDLDELEKYKNDIENKLKITSDYNITEDYYNFAAKFTSYLCRIKELIITIYSYTAGRLKNLNDMIRKDVIRFVDKYGDNRFKDKIFFKNIERRVVDIPKKYKI